MARLRRIEIAPEMLVSFFKEGKKNIVEVLNGFPADFNLVHIKVSIDVERQIQKIILYGTSQSFEDVEIHGEPPLLDIIIRENNVGSFADKYLQNGDI